MSLPLEIIIKGAKVAKRELELIEIAEREATKFAMRKAQNRIKTEVRRDLRGAPRWGRRGRSRVYAEAVDLGFRNHPRGGPIGKFTGRYYAGVGGKRRIKVDPLDGMFVGGVGIGGRRIPENNFKKQWENKYPTFEPAVDRASGELMYIYASAWAKAWNKRGY